MNPWKTTLTIGCILLLFILSNCSSDKISLWNGTDFSGWKIVTADDSVDVNTVWSIKNGVILCKGVPNGYMRTESEYSNYILHLNWRWVEKESNSGVFLHAQKPDQVWPKCIECQLHAGDAGDFILIGKGSITVDEMKHENTESYLMISKMQESSEKPAGEWNTYKIICEANKITCYVNGVLQNKGSQASLDKGHIAIQSEGAPIEFKNIYLELLK
ncbi:DUF1080 domain-containing protein [bacterium]